MSTSLTQALVSRYRETPAFGGGNMISDSYCQHFCFRAALPILLSDRNPIWRSVIAPVYLSRARLHRASQALPPEDGAMDHLAPKMLGGVSWQSAWVPAALTLTLRGQEDTPRCYMRLGGAFSPLGRRSSTEWQQSRDALGKRIGFAAQHHSPDTGLPFGYPIWSERSHR